MEKKESTSANCITNVAGASPTIYIFEYAFEDPATRALPDGVEFKEKQPDANFGMQAFDRLMRRSFGEHESTREHVCTNLKCAWSVPVSFAVELDPCEFIR